MLKKHIKRLLLAAAFLWTQLAWVAPVCYGEPASGSSLPNQTETMPGGGGETGDTFMMMLKVIFSSYHHWAFLRHHEGFG
ncbi:hypothetical protein P7H21_19370 [Paenibacillus larvae]|nr:hypothetical protein [Paenibacillus larvae]MDT2305661.1 hypothetical protein [Paenibacillus larvae]